MTWRAFMWFLALGEGNLVFGYLSAIHHYGFVAAMAMGLASYFAAKRMIRAGLL